MFTRHGVLSEAIHRICSYASFGFTILNINTTFFVNLNDSKKLPTGLKLKETAPRNLNERNE